MALVMRKIFLLIVFLAVHLPVLAQDRNGAVQGLNDFLAKFGDVLDVYFTIENKYENGKFAIPSVVNIDGVRDLSGSGGSFDLKEISELLPMADISPSASNKKVIHIIARGLGRGEDYEMNGVVPNFKYKGPIMVWLRLSDCLLLLLLLDTP